MKVRKPTTVNPVNMEYFVEVQAPTEYALSLKHKIYLGMEPNMLSLSSVKGPKQGDP